MFKSETYSNRRSLLKSKMNDGIILLLGNVDSPMNCAHNIYRWRQDSSFLYYWGLDFPGLAGIIDVDNNKDILFGDDVSLDSIIWMGPQIPIKENAERVGCANTMSFSKLHSYIKDALAQGRKIHFLPPYRAENKILLQNLLTINPSEQETKSSLELVHAIVSMREIKSDEEVVELKKAWDIGYNMHMHAMRSCKHGVWEQTIAGQMEGIALAQGNGASFPIILSQHGETLHNHNHNEHLETGRLMLADAGGESLMHYASDFTRTSPVGGKFSQQQKEIYNIVLSANNFAESITKAGETYLSIHLATAEIIAKGLKELGIMKGDTKEAVANGAHALFMPHGLGHMMGLDVHDMEDLNQLYVGYDKETQPAKQFGTASLRLGKRLKEGFVITNEPGIYFIPALIDKWKQEGTNASFINFGKLDNYRNFGGIRLEDDLLVTSDGCKHLGKRLPITVEEVESTIQEAL